MAEAHSTGLSPKPPVSPPRWKFAVIALMSIYPLLLVVLPTLGAVLGDYPYLAVPVDIGPEFFVRTFVAAAILVNLMVWVALPILTRLFGSWLQRQSGDVRRVEISDG